MRSFRTPPILAALVLAVGTVTSTARAQVGTAITYQGQLKESGSVVNSPTDMRFSLWNAAIGGAQIGSTVENLGVSVNAGLFTSSMDFGVNPYASNEARWLQIEVRHPAGSGSYVPMGSRQKLTAAPFSLATRGIIVDSFGRVFLNPTGPGSQNDLSFAVNAANPGMLSSFSVSNGGFATRLETLVDATTAGNPGGARIRMQSPNVGYGPLTLNDAMTIIAGPNGGTVGIGTNTPNPSTKLDVAGVGQMWGLELRVPGGIPVLDFSTDTTSDFNARLIYVAGDDSLNIQAVSKFTVDGNVGIGTTSPAAKLQVAGNSGLARVSAIFTDDTNSTLRIGHPANGVVAMGGNEDHILKLGGFSTDSNSFTTVISVDRVTNGGNVTIATGLALNGAVPNSGWALVLPNIAATPGRGLANRWDTYSSRDLKQNIETLIDPLDTLSKLRGVSFDWKAADEHGKHTHDIGFIAEEVNAVLPDIVSKNTDGKVTSMDYGRVVPVTVEAIKQLKGENDQLKARLEKIEALLASQATAK